MKALELCYGRSNVGSICCRLARLCVIFLRVDRGGDSNGSVHWLVCHICKCMQICRHTSPAAFGEVWKLTKNKTVKTNNIKSKSERIFEGLISDIIIHLYNKK